MNQDRSITANHYNNVKVHCPKEKSAMIGVNNIKYIDIMYNCFSV